MSARTVTAFGNGVAWTRRYRRLSNPSMTEIDPDAPELDAAAVETERRPRPSAALRGLSVVGLAALLVAAYALVQLRSGSNGTVQVDPPRFTPLASGSVAPEIDVPLFDGGRFTLSKHLAEDGRPVFLNMWASWCFPCRAEMPDIDEAAAVHPDIFFIGIAVDDREAPARDFVAERGIKYAIGFDERPIGDDGVEIEGQGRAVERAYGIWAMPTSYLIGSDGVIIERWFGPMRSKQIEEFLALAGSPSP